MILAAIDIGSNAARLLITDVHAYTDGSLDYTKLNLVRVPLRLGFDVFAHGSIGMERKLMMLKTMRAFQSLMDVYQVEHYKAAATSALRDAGNGRDIIDEIQKDCGLQIQIITGQEEANIIYENHFAEKLSNASAHLYIDVGGGSTECTLFCDDTVVAKESFNIGTIRMLTGKVEDKSWDALKCFIKDNSKKYRSIDAIGSGGNINKIFSLSKKKNGRPLTLENLKDFYKQMSPLTIEERMHLYDLKLDRADVIVPALEIYITIMRWANITDIYVPQIGVADGLIKILYKEIAAKL
jgi:exopolyphosphatase/guanosine-5'-triphosphate,3'-diphosphate pyrophosphatase